MLRLVLTLALAALTGCKTTGSSVAEKKPAQPTAAGYEVISPEAFNALDTQGGQVSEIGCVCEEPVQSKWDLYRYARLGERHFKVKLNQDMDLKDCLAEKFIEGNCQLKF